MNEQVKLLLNAPTVQPTVQGEGAYPRVIHQESRGDGTMLVTWAMPGLRRVRMIVPETTWVNGDHLSAPTALMRHVERCNPPVQHDQNPDHDLSD